MKKFQTKIRMFLLRRSRSILKVFLLTFCTEDPFLLSHLDMDIVLQNSEDRIFALPFHYFLIVQFVLFFIELGISINPLKVGRFTKLSLDRRLEIINRWEESYWMIKRMFFRLLKSICMANLWSHPDLLAAIGYHKPHMNDAGCR